MALEVFWGSGSGPAWRVLLALAVKGVPYESRLLSFAKGEHNPGSTDWQQLLAHELTHVVQQRGASTSGPLTVSQPGDALENEAEATAGDVGR